VQSDRSLLAAASGVLAGKDESHLVEVPPRLGLTLIVLTSSAHRQGPAELTHVKLSMSMAASRSV